MSEYIYLVILFPLLGVFINGLFGYRLKKGLIGFIACLSVFLSFVTAIFLFFNLLSLPEGQRSIGSTLYTWITSGDLEVSVKLFLDPLSSVMILVVSGVSSIIHIYSAGYMAEDKGFRRYFVYLNLFVFSMLLLVLAGNYLLMFIGWEGVGLCSYLLIGFWYDRKAPANAGKKAFIVNRVGDFGFLLGMMLIFVTFGTFDYEKIFSLVKVGGYLPGNLTITAITLLLFMGATGKSAQIPLYVWLPDAMEGPTPVSALIHAATMVTAGIYMIARSHLLYVLAPCSMEVVAVVGAITALFAASIGLVQFDIKRILAYSTISQLGLMFLSLGLGAFGAGIFHLMTHAFFKALLFLGAGSIMHALHGELDIRKMGGLKKELPVTHLTFLFGSLALAGIFPFAGFFSKDEILWQAYSQGHFILWAVASLASLFTAFYIFRALFMVFYGEKREPSHPHESPSIMGIPLIILAILSLIGGWIGIPLIEGGQRFAAFLSPVFGAVSSHIPAEAAGIETQEIFLMVFSLLLGLLGIGTAYLFYLKKPGIPEAIKGKIPLVHNILYHKYYGDEIYNFFVVGPLEKFANFLWWFFDTRIVDGLANRLAYLVDKSSAGLRRIQTGYIQTYAFSILFGFILLLFFLVGR